MIVLFAGTLAVWCSLAAGDSAFSVVPKRIAFGSCAKQYKTLELELAWNAVIATKPDAWIWMGDAIYPKPKGELVKSYREQKTNVHYQKLLSQVEILDGVIDDHDYGLNDGGKNWARKEEAKQHFLDFLGVPAESERRSRDGTYTVHVYGSPPHQIKLIMLDTRYNRDDAYNGDLGQHIFPLSSFVATFARWVMHFTGFGASYSGDMLGDTQWNWLENQITNSTANVHLIVSSIQVMTPLPLVESWGHFPVARRRLFDLLQNAKPKGVVFLSGDVHFAQILGRDDGVIELTSSGITHTVADYLSVWSVVEMLYFPNQTRYYEGTNFGLIETSFEDLENGVVATRVVGRILSRTGADKIGVDLNFRSDEDTSVRLAALDEVLPVIPERSFAAKMFRAFCLVIALAWLCQLAGALVYCFVKRMTRHRRRLVGYQPVATKDGHPPHPPNQTPEVNKKTD